MPVDRTLSITATPTLIWHAPNDIGATMAYAQTGSTPNMPNLVNSQTGNISLRNMPSNNNYTDNVDITITLDTSQLRDQSGNPVAGRWAYANEGNPPDDVGFCWFCTTPAPGQRKDTTEITIPGMTTGRTSDTVVFIDDNTADGDLTYTFCLGLVLPAYSNYYITIDPTIIGKGVGGGG